MARADMFIPLLSDAVKVFDLIDIIAIRGEAYAQGAASDIGWELFQLYHIAITILHRKYRRCIILIFISPLALMPFESDQIPKTFGRYNRSTCGSYRSLPSVECSLHFGCYLSFRFIGRSGSLDEVCIINEGVTHKTDSVAGDAGSKKCAKAFISHYF
jgi:hypothetical protein